MGRPLRTGVETQARGNAFGREVGCVPMRFQSAVEDGGQPRGRNAAADAATPPQLGDVDLSFRIIVVVRKSGRACDKLASQPYADAGNLFEGHGR